jgi:hypothetical protein
MNKLFFGISLLIKFTGIVIATLLGYTLKHLSWANFSLKVSADQVNTEVPEMSEHRRPHFCLPFAACMCTATAAKFYPAKFCLA